MLETEDTASEGAQSLFTYEGRGSSPWGMPSSAAATSVPGSHSQAFPPPLSAAESSDSDGDLDFADAASAVGSQSLVSSPPCSSWY